MTEPSIFNLLDACVRRLEVAGQTKRVQDLRAGFARGTNGADIEWLAQVLVPTGEPQ